MYDSLLDHFSHKPSKLGKAQLKNNIDMDAKKHTSTINTTNTSATSFQSDLNALTEASAARILTHKDQNLDAQWKPTRKELLIMATMAVSSLIVALDATILVPVLPTLAIELKGTAAETFWTGTSYLLSHAVLQPFIATLSDIFGRRELLVPGILSFAAGSVVCGIAHEFPVILAGRALQGVGGGSIIAISQLVFADIVPLRYRPKYFTMVLGAWALGSVLGPLVGGLLVEKASWRWCFWINLPICAIALLMAIAFVTITNTSRATLLQSLTRVDWLGNTLLIFSLTSLLVAVSWAGISYHWSDWQTIVPLLLGASGLVVTIIYEACLAPRPFLTPSLFNTPTILASYSLAALQGLALYMALYYTSFYFTSTHFFTAIRTGLSVFPATTLMLPGSAIVSALITRFAKFRWAIYTGSTISTLSSSLFILWDDKTPTAIWATGECLFGLGMGMLLSSVNFSVQANVRAEDAGQAAAMYAFARSVGMAIGVAVGGTVFQNMMKRKLLELGVEHAEEIAMRSEGFVETMRGMSRDGAEGVMRRDVMKGYVSGFRGVWIVMTAVCGLGLVVSPLVRRGDLDQVLVGNFQVGEAEKEGERRRS